MTHSHNNTPTHYVYTVRETAANKNDYWTKIGIAYGHQDGKGFSVMLEALPLDGKLTIRTAKPKTQH